MSIPDPGAVRAARALRCGHLQAVEARDLDALIANLADWMGLDLDARAVVLAEGQANPGPPDPKETR